MRLHRLMIVGIATCLLVGATVSIALWVIEDEYHASHPQMLATAQASDIEGFSQFVDFAGLYRQERNGKGGYVYGIGIQVRGQNTAETDLNHQLRSCLGQPLGLMTLYQHLLNESKATDLFSGDALRAQDRLTTLLHVVQRYFSASSQDTVAVIYMGTVPVLSSQLNPSAELAKSVIETPDYIAGYMAGFRKHPLSDRYKLARLILIFEHEQQIQQLADHVLPSCQVPYGYKTAVM